MFEGWGGGGRKLPGCAPWQQLDCVQHQGCLQEDSEDYFRNLWSWLSRLLNTSTKVTSLLLLYNQQHEQQCALFHNGTFIVLIMSLQEHMQHLQQLASPLKRIIYSADTAQFIAQRPKIFFYLYVCVWYKIINYCWHNIVSWLIKDKKCRTIQPWVIGGKETLNIATQFTSCT